MALDMTGPKLVNNTTWGSGVHKATMNTDFRSISCIDTGYRLAWVRYARGVITQPRGYQRSKGVMAPKAKLTTGVK